MNPANKYTVLVKSTTQKLGFDFCGIAKAVPLDDDARRLENWLNNQYQGNMHYMSNHFDMRIDPGKLVPGAKSVITVLKNYYPEAHQKEDAPKISKYAYGEDYHTVIRSQLNLLIDELKKEIGDFHGRGFVDSAPVLERAWAVKSGLGWVGKNGNLINKTAGSFYFIATLIIDVELEYDPPFTNDFCGTCTRCIDACPTDAILPGKLIDGSRCISYHTIELKEMLIAEEFKGKFDNWMFGCDVCQDVCPWNRFSKPNTDQRFNPIPEILNLSTKEWHELTEESFRKIFGRSPLKRSKFSGISRNLNFIESKEPGY